MKKLTFEFVQSEVSRKGGTLLSDVYINNRVKLKIKCNKCGFIWKSKYQNICSGRWCPNCSKTRKKSYSEISKLVEDREGILLSKSFKNVKDRVDIKCNVCGNIWNITIDGLLCGKWCRRCATKVQAGKYRSNIDSVKNTISSKGGMLLSEYKNNKTPLVVRCIECDNIWKPIYSNILKGKWCPKCRLKNRKGQADFLNIIKDIYSHCEVFNNYKQFDWLKNPKTGRKQEIDIFVKHNDFSLAIEYDVDQHYRPIDMFGGEDGYQNILYLDRNKDKLINSSNDVAYYVRVKYNNNLSKDDVVDILKTNNIPINNGGKSAQEDRS